MVATEKLRRWRLVLGETTQAEMEKFAAGSGFGLTAADQVMDEALAAIYDQSSGAESNSRGASKIGHGSFKLAKWLGDIRTLFDQEVVSVIQNDAIERKGMRQLLLEPEVLGAIQPDIEMVATLISLQGKIPERSKETARQLVAAVVAEIMQRLQDDLRKAVTGALNKRRHSPLPNLSGIDWKLTINRNLKHYNQTLQKLIPERIFFYERARTANSWTVILDMDQSGSMAESIIYGSIVGAIFASLPVLNTRVVAFDTEVVDLTEPCANDPVEMLFGIQLGGGTDINKSVAYCEQFIEEPQKTIFILLSDLYEGGNEASLVKRLEAMHEAGVKVLCLLALSDQGKPCYDESLTKKISSFGIPCFACSPSLLPELVEGALKGMELNSLAEQIQSRNRKN